MRCDLCRKEGVCKYQTEGVKKIVKELEDNITVKLDLDNEGEIVFYLECEHYERR